MTKETFIAEVIPLSDKLFRISFRLLKDRELARDVVQTVFLKLWDKRDDLPDLKNPEAYAVKMTRNACLDKIKLAKDQTEIVNCHETAENDYEIKELTHLIRKIIGSLPEMQRKIIELRDIEGLSFAEISGILSISENNIRVSLSVARKKLRESLKKAYDYGLS
jgi:RNA polymerase sigma-70 factor (ECF subfamily)